jgi:hypothetical protein
MDQNRPTKTWLHHGSYLQNTSYTTVPICFVLNYQQSCELEGFLKTPDCSYEYKT